MGFGVWGLGTRVSGCGFQVEGLRSRVVVSRLRDLVVILKVELRLGLRVSVLLFRVQC